MYIRGSVKAECVRKFRAGTAFNGIQAPFHAQLGKQLREDEAEGYIS